MYIAVNNFKKGEDSIINYSIFIFVVVFILRGFEHCIANMCYISLAKAWPFKSAISMLFMIFGNSFGAIIMSLFNNKNKIKA